jgi:hypothetical protein
VHDMLADSLVALLMTLEANPTIGAARTMGVGKCDGSGHDDYAKEVEVEAAATDTTTTAGTSNTTTTKNNNSNNNNNTTQIVDVMDADDDDDDADADADANDAYVTVSELLKGFYAVQESFPPAATATADAAAAHGDGDDGDDDNSSNNHTKTDGEAIVLTVTGSGGKTATINARLEVASADPAFGDEVRRRAGLLREALQAISVQQ